MKPKTTSQWTELFLKEFLQDIKDEGSGPENVDSITNLLKFHASQLQESAEQRLEQIERKVRALESDSSFAKMGGR